MFLIVGLGNPGSKYTYTRHNIGFLCVEHCLEVIEESGVTVGDPKKEQKSAVWKIKFRLPKSEEEVLFVEPLTFMNLSGEAVQGLMAYYKIPLENILVIQDDLDLPFGRMKFLKDRGPGGHNGIKNITERLGTANYARMKLGVGGFRHPGQEGADFVLGNFTKEEAEQLGPVFDRALEGLKSFIENGYEKTTNVFNERETKTKEEE